MRTAGALLIALQLAAMLALSTYQYGRFSLTLDFGYTSEAWWAIGHGHLDPWSSLLRAPYWKNNGEFWMWPAALISHIWSSPLALLWLQDLAVCATGWVALGWCLEVLEEASDTIRTDVAKAVGAVVVGAIVLDPWAYETIAFDFHSEAILGLFLVITARALWSGRRRRLWWSVPLTLLSMTIGGLYLFGLGVAGVIARRSVRLEGAIIGVLGMAWFLTFSALGAVGVEGRISGAYSYLTGASGARLDMTGILRGVVRHPGAVGTLLGHRWPVLVSFLVVVGLVGVCSLWAAGVTIVAFVPALLSGSDLFFRTTASFQIWPAIPFVLVGTVMLIASPRMAAVVRPRARLVAVGVWATCLLVLAAIVIPQVPRDWIRVDAGAAEQLNLAQRTIPQDAEVIASGGVVGRFSDHRFVYNYPFNSHAPGQSATRYPLERRVVVFVFTPRQGIAEAPPQETLSAIRFVRRHGGRTLIEKAGVYVLSWSPPPRQSSLLLP